MMNDIQRYALYNDSDGIWKDDDGEVVLYDDHLEEVKQLEDHIAYLEKELLEEYERGFFNGACTGYGQG